MKGLNGLVGKDVRYSFSQIIHEMISDTKYQLYSLKNLHDILKLDFEALNITNPYKQEIIQYIDVLDEEAQNIGSVNTIIKKNNQIYGYNTDYFGFIKTLEKFNVKVENKNILILGNGATAKMIKYALIKLKANQLDFLVRTKRGQNEYLLNEQIPFDKYHIIINTTPVGNMLYDEVPFDLNLALFANLEVVIDLNYNPLTSKLLIKAQEKNALVINGLYMLTAQALRANYFLTNNEQILTRIDEIYYQLLAQQINLVLIGMPNAGKTTIGKELAKIYHKEFIDTDELFFKKYHISTSEFLSQFSEDEFRNKETKIIESIQDTHNAVISTGGGIILRKENIDNLKKNGIIIFIHKDLNLLKEANFNNRPLVKSNDDLEKLYNERINRYYQYSQIVINNNQNLTETIDEIKVKLNEIFNH